MFFFKSERPCVGASLNLRSLEEAEENDVLPDSSDNFTYGYSDFTASWPIQSPSLMTEILSEFMDITKAEEQREHSSDRYLHFSPFIYPVQIHPHFI